MSKLKNFVAGSWLDSKTDEFEAVYNPATEEVLAEVPISTREELDEAVAKAEEAFKTWSRVDVIKRARIMFKFHELILEHKMELAQIITKENGKSIGEALGEVGRGLENVEFAASAPSMMMGDSLSAVGTDVEVTNYKYPVGVVGGIAPFNFPMMVPCWMFPMAIVCGNSFVLKPSEKTPMLASRLAELLAEAGLPDGVFNIVNGAKDVVNGLLENPAVKAISFVGSKGVGEYVYKTGTANLKRVQALTGAKNHTIVLKDANIDVTVKNVISAAFGSAGERCMACAVLAIEAAIYDDFMEALVKATKAIKIGNGLEKDVFLGPVIRKENQERTLAYIEKGIKEGATLRLDGREKKFDKGYFVAPTIFENVTPEMSLWTDEIFAPILSVVKIKNLQEGVELANSHTLANGACLFTNNASSIRYFRENIDAGMLGVNLGVPAPVAFFAFSGWKDSFYGDLHCNGKDSIEFYTHRKVVTARYPKEDI
ncbi:CoA-acylating methylmalonate-semialdehyde dehydrogenase [Lactococcus termiticola]|uniref:methylmalonate-semialdehyde dehydrogenase (CoA acylating) n=1 Tax=Lactococcus termiticola TaxID=2169526 RepID=A0A2R5HHU9_9LACT|nr:CoA-acylating methylmalonate-semialdehyde dehydrogenase [Lactococcus termiticola]GBG96955.1 lactaldehyde/glycolaldehyde dehydrogenase [Lactococcus termiticola]